MSTPTLQSQFVEFRRGRSLEPRKMVVQGTSDSNGAAYLTASHDVRATYFARGNKNPVPYVASGALTPKSSLDYVNSAAGPLVMTIADLDPSTDTLVNGVVKTIVNSGANTVVVAPTTGDGAILPASPSAVTYIWDTTRWSIMANGGATPVSPLSMPDGTAAAPGLAFVLDVDTGFFRAANDTLSFATNGTEAARFTPNQQLHMEPSAGSAATPSYSFIGDTDTGMYWPAAANNIAIATGGVNAMQIDAAQTLIVPNGDVLVTRPAATQAEIIVRGGDNTAARVLSIETGAAGNGWYLASPAGNDDLLLFNAGTSVNLDFSIDCGAGDIVNAGTGQVLNADGAIGAPSYSFQNDPDTGMFAPGGNVLTIGTGGTTAITVDSNQDVFLPSGRLNCEQIADANNAEVITATGAISPNIGTTFARAPAANINMTLANGTVVGAIKHVILTASAGGFASVQPASTIGAYTFVTLTVVGHSASFVWADDGTTSGWALVYLGTGTAAAGGVFVGPTGPSVT